MTDRVLRQSLRRSSDARVVEVLFQIYSRQPAVFATRMARLESNLQKRARDLLARFHPELAQQIVVTHEERQERIEYIRHQEDLSREHRALRLKREDELLTETLKVADQRRQLLKMDRRLLKALGNGNVAKRRELRNLTRRLRYETHQIWRNEVGLYDWSGKPDYSRYSNPLYSISRITGEPL